MKDDDVVLYIRMFVCLVFKQFRRPVFQGVRPLESPVFDSVLERLALDQLITMQRVLLGFFKAVNLRDIRVIDRLQTGHARQSCPRAMAR